MNDYWKNILFNIIIIVLALFVIVSVVYLGSFLLYALGITGHIPMMN